MAEPSVELQAAIYATLTGDAGLMAMVGGVYDRIPDTPYGDTSGYISFGAEDSVPDDADCIIADEYTIQIDVWSQKVGREHCKQICHKVKSLLHDVTLSLPTHANVMGGLTLVRILKDPDGLTMHGILQFAHVIEDRSP